MTARRALLEEGANRRAFDTSPRHALLNEQPTHEVVNTTATRALVQSVARRALDEAAAVTTFASRPRRALTETTAATNLASRPRRALDEPLIAANLAAPARRGIVADVETTIVDIPVAKDKAFIKPRHTVRKIVAGVSVLAALGGLSSRAIAGSLAINAPSTPAASSTQQANDETVATPNQQPASLDAASDPLEVADTTSATTTTPQADLPLLVSASEQITTVIAPGQKQPVSVPEALKRAAGLVGSSNYQNMCLALVSTFYGYTSSGVNSATDAAAAVQAAGQMHTDMSDIPVGALIWYDGSPAANPYGHVAMYAGNGMIYSNGAPTGVGLISINEPAQAWREPIIGWSNVWLPAATK